MYVGLQYVKLIVFSDDSGHLFKLLMTFNSLKKVVIQVLKSLIRTALFR